MPRLLLIKPRMHLAVPVSVLPLTPVHCSHRCTTPAGSDAKSLLRLQFLDGGTVQAVQHLNKVVRTALAEEQHILTVDNPRFIHGTGTVTIV